MYQFVRNMRLRKNKQRFAAAVTIIPLLQFSILGCTGHAENTMTVDEVSDTAAIGKEVSSVLLNYTNKESIEIIKDFCIRELNLNGAAVSGVVANMTAESGLRTTALGDGGTSFGLCQWHNERWDELRSFAESLDRPPDDIEVQLYFFKSELQGPYQYVYQYLQNAEDSEKGAFDSGYIMCVDYEKPADSSVKGNCRGAWAVSDYRAGFCISDEDITLLKLLYMLNIRANTVIDAYSPVPAGGYATVDTINAIEYDESWWRAENCLTDETDWLEDDFEDAFPVEECIWETDRVEEPDKSVEFVEHEEFYDVEKESKNDAEFKQ